jgi:hypothetical protein
MKKLWQFWWHLAKSMDVPFRGQRVPGSHFTEPTLTQMEFAVSNPSPPPSPPRPAQKRRWSPSTSQEVELGQCRLDEFLSGGNKRARVCETIVIE